MGEIRLDLQAIIGIASCAANISDHQVAGSVQGQLGVGQQQEHIVAILPGVGQGDLGPIQEELGAFGEVEEVAAVDG